MSRVITGFRYLLTEIVAMVLFVLLLAGPVLGLVHVDILTYAEIAGALESAVLFMMQGGNESASLGAVITVIVVLFIIHFAVLGFAAQHLWGWERHRGYTYTGIKFLIVGLFVRLSKKLAGVIAAGVVALLWHYDILQQRGFDDPVIMVIVAVLSIIIGLWLTGFVARLFGWR